MRNGNEENMEAMQTLINVLTVPMRNGNAIGGVLYIFVK